MQRMEREELELINRLKNTKLLEEAAHNELEGALTDPDPGQRLAQTQSQFSYTISVSSVHLFVAQLEDLPSTWPPHETMALPEFRDARGDHTYRRLANHIRSTNSN